MYLSQCMVAIELQHRSITLESIAASFATAPKSAQRKLLALQLLLTGKNHKEVCAILRIGRNSLTRWIKSANSRGLDGLFENKKVGRPFKIDMKDTEIFENALSNPPELSQMKSKKWTGKLFQKFLERKFGKKFSISLAYRIYRNTGALIKKRQVQKNIKDHDAPELLLKIYRRKIVQNLAIPNAPYLM